MRTRKFTLHALGIALVVLGCAGSGAEARPMLDPVVAHAPSVCADYPNQAAAQRAHDTRDPDHDGIYCEDLPCPCLKPGQSDGSGGGNGSAPAQDPPSCTTPTGVQSISFSATKYPNIR